MNANELADWVEQQSSFGWSGDFGKFLIDIAAILRQQQAEIADLKKEKWLTEIDAKQQALKQIIDWLVIEHDALACSSYPLRK